MRRQPENLSKQQLQTLIATARTSADHERLAKYYEAKAQSNFAESTVQAKMAVEFRQNPVTSSPKWATGTVNHCEYFAQRYHEDALKMESLAREQQRMAKAAGGQ